MLNMADKIHPKWARFGKELRSLRGQAALSQVELGEQVRLSHGLISAFERGTRKPGDDYVLRLDGALSAGGALVRLWEAMNKSAGVPSPYSAIDSLEQSAVEIRTYSPMVVPGLLQTEEY